MSALARGTASALRAMAGLAIAAALAGLMVKRLYGTAIGRRLLDCVPIAAWETGHRALGVAAQNVGVEAQQNADALVVFMVCLVFCIALTYALGRLARRTTRRTSTL